MDVNSIFESNFSFGNFFILPRDLVDGTFTNEFFTEDELFYLLLMYSFRDTKHKDRAGFVTTGEKSFKRYVRPIKKEVFQEIQKSIMEKQFIFKLQSPNRYMQYGIALPPLYDKDNDMLFQRYPNVEFTQQNIDKYKMNFIKVPISLITNQIITPRNKRYHLDITEIYLILLLYRYNFIETFGGVDFSIICMSKDKIKIDSTIYQNLNLTTKNEKNKLLDSLKFLEDIGIYKWTEIVIEKEAGIRGRYLFISDLAKYKKPLTSNMKVIKVIRLFHQPFMMKEYTK